MTTYAFPGYVADVTALTSRIEATWGNAIRDRSNQVFATTAARDLAIPTPQVGQVCIITTGTGAGEYVYSGATVGWTLPWNQPWGSISAVLTPGSLSFNNAGATTTTFSVTLVLNRLYVAHMYAELQNGAVTGVVDTIVLRDSTGAADVGTFRTATPPAANSQIGQTDVVRIASPGSGARLYRIKGTASASATNQTLASPQVWFEDIGPNGAPS